MTTIADGKPVKAVEVGAGLKALDDIFFRLIMGHPMTRLIVKLGRKWSAALESFALILICILCFIVRLFAVLRYESVIHEFDPYFNYRTTRYLAKEGFMEFWNWFDEASWYPLGRVVGQTLFPGLMTTAAVLHGLLHFFGMVIDIKDVCVFLAPIFSAFTAISSYLLVTEVTGKGPTGLLAALFIGLSPAYLSRSVAGSYDNEAVAIFALIFAFYLFIKALNSRSILMSILAALGYFYMVASWGGYVFITNCISIYMVALTGLGRLRPYHYVAYCVWYVTGTVFCLNIPFVNIAAIHSSEHLASHGVFFLLNAYFFGQYLRSLAGDNSFKYAMRFSMGSAVLCIVGIIIWLSASGRVNWAGRSMTLLVPNYAAKNIPIIASVSEHQPTTWASYIFDIHLPILLTPAGLFIAFTTNSDGYLFTGIYAILAAYFSGVMVRLMLVLAPATAIMASIGLSFILYELFSRLHSTSLVKTFISSQRKFAEQVAVSDTSPCEAPRSRRDSRRASELSNGQSLLSSTGNGLMEDLHSPSITVSPWCMLVVLAFIFMLGVKYINHAVFASALAYSHPSVINSQYLKGGSRIIQDDFREAFYWFRKNTHEDARLMSWWDYGYQCTAMGNRTVLVDNNTWNNTHIATVGLAFASPEEEAYRISLQLDVDYVFVIFGANARHSGDDINKFTWMIRIAGGEYPWIKEENYMSASGQYRVGKDASKTLVNSLMYKLSYYRYKEMDHVRNEYIEHEIALKYFEEAYTTENWLVRVYRVKKPPNRQPVLPRSSTVS